MESPLFPLVILLAGDAQRLRCCGGRELSRADLEDHLRPVFGFGIHLLRFCRNRLRAGKLVDLLQTTGEPGRAQGALALLEQGLEPRAQGFAPGQVDAVLQRLEHALHGPLLPVVEGDPVDVELTADLRRLAALRPHRQHRLDFVLRTVKRRVVGSLFAFRLFRRGFCGGHKRVLVPDFVGC